jgi:hypothetical protein
MGAPDFATVLARAGKATRKKNSWRKEHVGTRLCQSAPSKLLKTKETPLKCQVDKKTAYAVADVASAVERDLQLHICGVNLPPCMA